MLLLPQHWLTLGKTRAHDGVEQLRGTCPSFAAALSATCTQGQFPGSSRGGRAQGKLEMRRDGTFPGGPDLARLTPGKRHNLTKLFAFFLPQEPVFSEIISHNHLSS